MKQIRMAITLLATGAFVLGGIAATKQNGLSEMVETQTATGTVLRDLADKDNPTSANRWHCQNVQTQIPCYFSYNPETDQYDIPSTDRGYAESY